MKWRGNRETKGLRGLKLVKPVFEPPDMPLKSYYVNLGKVHGFSHSPSPSGVNWGYWMLPSIVVRIRDTPNNVSVMCKEHHRISKNDYCCYKFIW